MRSNKTAIISIVFQRSPMAQMLPRLHKGDQNNWQVIQDSLLVYYSKCNLVAGLAANLGVLTSWQLQFQFSDFEEGMSQPSPEGLKILEGIKRKASPKLVSSSIQHKLQNLDAFLSFLETPRNNHSIKHRFIIYVICLCNVQVVLDVQWFIQ